jgi:hypothetical protein
MVSSPNAAATAIAFARSHIGDPYVWAATGPHAWDCSGLVMKAYASAGVILPRTTGMMINVGTPVTRDQLQPGDLVFPDFHHVQIYTGNGKIIEAPQSGEFVVERPMWGFWRARRVVTGVQSFGIGDIPIGGALDPNTTLGGLGDVISSLNTVAKWLGDSHNWLRMGYMAAGFVFILVAIFNFDTVKSAATSAAKGAVNAGRA